MSKLCEQVACEQVVGGGGGRRRRAGDGSAEPKTRTPHKDVWNKNLFGDMKSLPTSMMKMFPL